MYFDNAEWYYSGHKSWNQNIELAKKYKTEEKAKISLEKHSMEGQKSEVIKL